MPFPEYLLARAQETYGALDEKVPYFPIVLAGIILLLAAGLYLIFTPAVAQQSDITIIVKNPAGVPVKNALVAAEWDGLDSQLLQSTGEDGTAPYKVPAGKGITVTVSKAGYDTLKKTVNASAGQTFEFALKPVQAGAPKEVTINFVGPDGKKITGDVSARLGCSGSGRFEKQDYLITGGELKVTSPENCGRIAVTANATGFLTANENVLSSQWVVKFAGIEQPKGKIQFDVRDEANGNFLDGISITMKDSLGGTAGSATTSFGEADFTLPADTYTAVVSDLAGAYATQSLHATVDAGDIPKKQQVSLTKEVKLRPKVIVKEGTGAPIAGATVSLLRQSGEIYDEKKTWPDGNALFVLGDDGTFSIQVSKDGYLASRPLQFRTGDFAKGSEKPFEISLEKCGPATCGILTIRVVDENGAPVENAAVSLLDNGGLVAPYGGKTTDFNGFAAQFTGVAAGTYYVLAQKYPAQGKSEAFEVKSTSANSVTMKIIIGSGRVDVSAQDLGGNAVAFATADIFTDYGNKIGAISLDAEGRGTLAAVKADKRIYAIVRKAGYAPYFTASQQVMKDKTLQFNAVLETQIAGDRPSVEFKGLFIAGAGSAAAATAGAGTGTAATSGTGTATGTGTIAAPTAIGTQVQSMQAGRAYTARFVLRVPTNAGLEAAGFFFRAGNRTKLEDDVLYIESVSAPLPAIAQGAAYSPPAGEAALSTGNAKWASMLWDMPEGGKYEIEATVRVVQGATKGTELPLYYRTWGLKAGKYLRDPNDPVLGDKQESAVRGNLYAESQQLLYLEEMDQLCRESFCFGTRLLDTSQSLYVQPPYKLRTFSPYTLEFSLTNNSQAILDGATLAVRDTRDGTKAEGDVSIDAYEITDADAVKRTSTTPVPEITAIPSGNMRQNRSMRGELMLSAKTQNPSALEFRLFAGQNIAFTSLVPFTTFYQDDINITAGPQQLAAFIPNTLLVSVQYAVGDKKGFPVDAAHIVVTRRAPDLSETAFAADTNSQGAARIEIPASSPGTKLTIRAEKSGVGVRQITKEIGAQVATFAPDSIDASLNRETKEQENEKIIVTNTINRGLVIGKIGLSMNSRGLLDEEKMQSALSQYAGTELPNEGSQAEINVLSVLGNEAQSLDVPRAVNGALVVQFSLKGDPAISWFAEIPYSAQINLAQMPINAPCISISAKDWKDTTLNSRSDLEFEVQNNCITENGEPVELKNLQGQIEWNGNDGQTGQVELSIIDPDTGTSSGEILQQGLWSRMSQRLRPRVIYAGRLSFVPKPNTLGKKAGFTVKIDAEIVTNSGKQFVGSSNPIEAEIVITNLDQCIEITPHPEEGIEIGRSGDESQFTVDTSKCGPIAIDLRFCGGGSDQCRGGTHEGGLTLRPWQFSNISESSGGGTSRTVKVQGQDMPGMYGITVEARPHSGQWRQVASIDTIVKPDTDRYFDLDKYQFTIIGKGSTDDATLTNKMLVETVQVRANMCDWQEASSGPNFTGMGVGIGMVGGIVVGYLASTITVAGAALSPFIAAGIGAVVAVVIIIIMAVLDDPCAKFATHPLQDYVINLAGTIGQGNERYLPSDALNIMMSDSHIAGTWNTKITDYVLKSGKNGKQTVGVVFENKGITQQQPLYAIGTFTATEHVHGDSQHQTASVNCQSGNFGYFWLNPGTCPPSLDMAYSQKFHLRFRTAEQKASLPKITFDTQACQSGIDIGRTGKGALPRVKLNWSWNENAGGIGAESCDATNPDYIYCDATQFTIELSKKMGRLYDFLKENNYDLGCPALPDPGKETQDELDKNNGTREVAEGAIGIYKVEPKEDSGAITSLVTVKNNTDFDQNLLVALDMRNGGAYSEGCVLDFQQIPPRWQKQSVCSKPYTGTGAFAIYASVKSAGNNAFTDFGGISTGIYIPPTTAPDAKQAICDLKTTETFNGTPHILRFIDSKPDVKWTAAVPDRDALLRLIQFDAYLMKDNYSKEFFNDFQDYYTNRNFEDTDTHFDAIESDSAGRYGFNRLMQANKFKLTRRYVETSELPGPGLYRVEIAAYFDKEGWKFFGSDGTIKSGVAIVVNRKQDPFPASPFYSMPFDGLVGLEGDTFKRQNYGVAFNNSQTEMAEISSEAVPFKTYQNSAGLGSKQASVQVERGFYSLNVSPQSRGMLLEVNSPPGNKSSIIFQPANATPVVLKATQADITDDKFSRYYSLLEDENPINAGNTLTYWDGAGTCLDFTGAPITEAFYQKPDTTASGGQGGELKNYYTQNWPLAVRTGDVYLRTIMYTDPQANYHLNAQTGERGISLLTADDSGSAVALKGVGGMPYNNPGAGSLGTVQDMQDVFSLAEQGQVCVSNNGNTTKFFWNPQRIYDREGTQRNVSAFTNSLEAGNTCIG